MNILKKFVFTLFIFQTSISLAQTIIPSSPEINVESYILMDASTGKIIASGNPDSQIEPASMTKVMSAYVIADQLKQKLVSFNDLVLVSEKAWKMEGSRTFIEVGKKVPLIDLLRGLVIQSGNDATVALAEYIAGTEEGFVDVMNAYASEMGLSNTLFQNSTGLPNPSHFTSTRDLAVLGSRLISEFPDHYKLYKEREFTFNEIRQVNRNKLLWQDDSVDGIKTGFTSSAGYCLISSAERNGMRLISVVAGSATSQNTFTSSQRLLEYGFRFFSTKKLLNGNEMIQTSKVWAGKSDSVPLGLESDLILTVPRATLKTVTFNYKINSNIEAPISKGTKLGVVDVLSDGKLLTSKPLIALDAVEEKGFLGRFIDKLILWFINLFDFNND